MLKLYHIKQNKTIRILQEVFYIILLKCDKNQQKYGYFKFISCILAVPGVHQGVPLIWIDLIR